MDNFYLGNAIYYDNTRKDVVKPDLVALQKADTAFGNVIAASPNTADAYLFRARTNRLAEKDELMAKYYEDYINVVLKKWESALSEANQIVDSKVLELYKGTLKDANYEIFKAELDKVKNKFTEAYNNMAAFYANTDKAKAKELFNKTLALDPTNNNAIESLKLLK